MPDIKAGIQETIGILSQSPKGWNKELNLISWNSKSPKFDLRDWSPEHEDGHYFVFGRTKSIEGLINWNGLMKSK